MAGADAGAADVHAVNVPPAEARTEGEVRGRRGLSELNMTTPMQGTLLRIFVGESDRWQHAPLYEAIVQKARQMHLAGATVLKGVMGFGAHSRLHTTKVLRLSEDMPMVIEIVDERAKIDAFLPVLQQMVREGLVTLEDVQVLMYRSEAQGG